MARFTANPVHRLACVGAVIIAAALVLVPTIMRARQRVELCDATQLSIRLNWQSDAPPRMMSVTPQTAGVDLVVPGVLASQPHATRPVPRAHAFDEPVLQPPLDNAPDLLRGPPAPHSPVLSAFAAL